MQIWTNLRQCLQQRSSHTANDTVYSAAHETRRWQHGIYHGMSLTAWDPSTIHAHAFPPQVSLTPQTHHLARMHLLAHIVLVDKAERQADAGADG
eukprot:365725-Chlamydomonas_euryale.AAC.37